MNNLQINFKRISDISLRILCLNYPKINDPNSFVILYLPNGRMIN